MSEIIWNTGTYPRGVRSNSPRRVRTRMSSTVIKTIPLPLEPKATAIYLHSLSGTDNGAVVRASKKNEDGCNSGSEFRSTRVTVQSSLNPSARAFAWLFSASPRRFQMFDTSVPPYSSSEVKNPERDGPWPRDGVEAGDGGGARGRRLSPLAPLSTGEALGRRKGCASVWQERQAWSLPCRPCRSRIRINIAGFPPLRVAPPNTRCFLKVARAAGVALFPERDAQMPSGTIKTLL